MGSRPEGKQVRFIHLVCTDGWMQACYPFFFVDEFFHTVKSSFGCQNMYIFSNALKTK